MRGQVRAHGIVRPARGGLAEPVLVLAQQCGPFFLGPRPVGPAGTGALLLARSNLVAGAAKILEVPAEMIGPCLDELPRPKG
jgi:hypothetical protein